MAKTHYIAYGSNLHPLRLAERVPSARAVGVVEMPGHRLAFHKRSVDGSAKGHIYTDEVRHLTAYGVLYEFDVEDKPHLDAAEGPGYRERIAKYPVNGETYRSFTYIARSTHIAPDLAPYHWYKELVLAGARYHGFPGQYIARIEATPSTGDPDPARAERYDDLLRQMTCS